MSGVPIQLSGDTLYMSSTLIKVIKQHELTDSELRI